MTLDKLKHYCLQKPQVTSGYPFRKETLVFKSSDKVFCLVRTNLSPLSINLKCEPEEALILRENYPAITPGYHMNKKLWNTISLDGSLTESEIKKMIDDSYRLVAKG
jgi:predicted DNA-binding protein (MmcQ/YjbR family)